MESVALRESGLSWRRITTLRDLAPPFTDGRLDEDVLSGLPDDEIPARLTSIPGIGPWTVQGPSRRPPTRGRRPPGDLALRRAVEAADRLDHRPTEDEVVAIAEKWWPSGSLATSFLFSAAFGPAG